MTTAHETLSATEMRVYDMVMHAGEHGVGVGTVVATLGANGRTHEAIQRLLRSFVLFREGTRLFAE